MIENPELNGLQNFQVPDLPEALKVLQVCFNSKDVSGCFKSIHTALRPSNGWYVLTAPIGSQAYLIPGEGDSWSGNVLLVSVAGGMISVAEPASVGQRSSIIVVNPIRIFRPDDILIPSTRTTTQIYPMSREISRRHSSSAALAEAKTATSKFESAKLEHVAEVDDLKVLSDAKTHEVSLCLQLIHF